MIKNKQTDLVKAAISRGQQETSGLYAVWRKLLEKLENTGSVVLNPIS